MIIWSNVDGKDIPFELVEGIPLVLRYYGEIRFGRFIKIECVGHGRWKHMEIYVSSKNGTIFSGPMYWFSPIVTEEDSIAFKRYEMDNNESLV